MLRFQSHKSATQSARNDGAALAAAQQSERSNAAFKIKYARCIQASTGKIANPKHHCFYEASRRNVTNEHCWEQQLQLLPDGRVALRWHTQMISTSHFPCTLDQCFQ